MLEPLVIDWSIFSDWSEALLEIVRVGNLEIFTSYAQAAEMVAVRSLNLYRGYLQGARLPNGAAIQHPSGQLAEHATLMGNGQYLGYVLHNDAAYSEAIERGTKSRDLKDMLPTAHKARRGKDGALYLIIPFRHGTPGTVGLRAMPQGIWERAMKLSRSRITGHRMEPSVTHPGEMVQRNVYGFFNKEGKWVSTWGRHLTLNQVQNAGGSFKEQSIYQGMYKFGLPRHSQYITFRVMSQNSAPGSWIRKAVPPLWPARFAAEEGFRQGKSFLEEALTEDIMRIVKG